MKPEKNKNTISVKVESPVGDWTHDFDKNAKVSDVIQEALKHFGLEGNYELRRVSDNETLQLDRPLISYHLENNVVLSLIPETGGGA